MWKLYKNIKTNFHSLRVEKVRKIENSLRNSQTVKLVQIQLKLILQVFEFSMSMSKNFHFKSLTLMRWDFRLSRSFMICVSNSHIFHFYIYHIQSSHIVNFFTTHVRHVIFTKWKWWKFRLPPSAWLIAFPTTKSLNLIEILPFTRLHHNFVPFFCWRIKYLWIFETKQTTRGTFDFILEDWGRNKNLETIFHELMHFDSVTWERSYEIIFRRKIINF